MAELARAVGAKDATADGFIAWLDALSQASIGIPRTLARRGRHATRRSARWWSIAWPTSATPTSRASR